MTAVEQDYFDFEAIDREYQARIEIVAGDWLRGDEDAQKFVAALKACRTGEQQLIYQDDVRIQMTESTVKGPRICINHNRYSALWNTCRKHGLIAFHRDTTGQVITTQAKTSTTGNNNKWMPVYRWIGHD